MGSTGFCLYWGRGRDRKGSAKGTQEASVYVLGYINAEVLMDCVLYKCARALL